MQVVQALDTRVLNKPQCAFRRRRELVKVRRRRQRRPCGEYCPPYLRCREGPLAVRSKQLMAPTSGAQGLGWLSFTGKDARV